MFKRFIRVAAVTSLALIAMPSFAVKTFNCSKATATVAQIICNDNRLSKLDDDLDKVYDDYAEILQNFNDEDKNKLFETFKQNHLDWQKNVLVPCQSAKCAEDVYTQRIGEFNKMNNTFRKQIQEAKTGSGAGGTKAQPSVASNPVKSAPINVSSHAVANVVKEMGITNPTLENVAAMTIQILKSADTFLKLILTDDHCGIYNAHPKQNIVMARFADISPGGYKSLGAGLGSTYRVYCKNNKACFTGSRNSSPQTDGSFDPPFRGDPDGKKLEAGIFYLSEACTALSR